MAKEENKTIETIEDLPGDSPLIQTVGDLQKAKGFLLEVNDPFAAGVLRNVNKQNVNTCF